MDFKEVVQKICDSILSELGYLKLGYRIIVLTLADEKKGVLKRISLSQTFEAAKAQAASAIPFHDIEIPLDAQKNLLIQTLHEKKPRSTHFWPDIFTPVLTPKEAIANQKASGIKTSMLYPVTIQDKALGVLIFSMVKDEKEVSEAEEDLIRGFTDVVGLAVQNAKLYTSLSETTAKLDKANKRLQELDKLKDDFVSMASHELRTPMTAIKSYLWMALNKKKQDLTPDLNRYIFRAFHSTERLINLVNDMLNISRIESGRIALNLAEVDPVELVHEVVDEVIPKATELNLNVKVIDRQVSKVLCDRDKIHEVIINLIGNSLKFTKQGGSISITFEEKAPFIYISVTDTGVGLAKEDMDRLFKKFSMIEHSYTAASASGGTGLGLYISKSIVILHKGDITAYSPGREKGSTFTLSLPIAGTSTALELIKEAPKVTQDSKGLEKKRLGYI
ncbi:MAG: Multi-sensor hybrid histidine kinase [Candidatus Curtissbacteria bacterium GW2011_GWA1_41_11]|uniref:histidine kinase n=1 Tax=Candidatus Curtissbacteria bacterium GW2011_GWA1_41_11 TaxID=1618409 RepID=A0A0G0UKP1_9BACT|nr:MAG: Multi-sensor hybrid histidine kinase [Candidatus Curtissbacteria bacterium GW2011_GWA1_41_11]